MRSHGYRRQQHGSSHLGAITAVCLALTAAPAFAQVFGSEIFVNSYGPTDNGTNSHDQFVDLATGGKVWIAVWEASLIPGTGPDTDFDIAFARSNNHGATWSTAAPIHANAATEIGQDRLPRVAHAGSTWLVVWTSDASFGGGIGPDREIYSARSTNGGASWSESGTPLNTNAATDGLTEDDKPVVAGDGAGTWVAVWQVATSGGPLGNDWDLMMSRSTDDGVSWSAPAILNSYAATDTGFDWNPTLVYDQAGGFLVAWQSAEPFPGTLNKGTDWDLLFMRSTNGGVSWSAHAVLNTDAAADSDISDLDVDLACEAAGHCVAAWQKGNPGIRYARSSNSGVTWTAPAPVLATGFFADLVYSDGKFVVTWNRDVLEDEAVDRDVFVAHSLDNGNTWLDVTNVTPGDANGDFLPQVAAVGPNLGIAWYGNDVPGIGGIENDIFFRGSGPPVPALPYPLALVLPLVLALGLARSRMRPSR